VSIAKVSQSATSYLWPGSTKGPRLTGREPPFAVRKLVGARVEILCKPGMQPPSVYGVLAQLLVAVYLWSRQCTTTGLKAVEYMPRNKCKRSETL
jgi:hypothetical protein